MNIYAGNLSYNTDDDALNEAFSEFGEVESAKVIMDRDSGRSKGFGFVEMSSDDDGKKAIEALDGTDLDGRTIKVNEARPRPDHR
ncbi:MAG: RNA-binding protein [Hyphomicrobiaceae bacterium]|nr:RNA-binding protein [Hyphomicrobiaceae bacterium]